MHLSKMITTHAGLNGELETEHCNPEDWKKLEHTSMHNFGHDDRSKNGNWLLSTKFKMGRSKFLTIQITLIAILV